MKLHVLRVCRENHPDNSQLLERRLGLNLHCDRLLHETGAVGVKYIGSVYSLQDEGLARIRIRRNLLRRNYAGKQHGQEGRTGHEGRTTESQTLGTHTHSAI